MINLSNNKNQWLILKFLIFSRNFASLKQKKFEVIRDKFNIWITALISEYLNFKYYYK